MELDKKSVYSQRKEFRRIAREQEQNQEESLCTELGWFSSPLVTTSVKFVWYPVNRYERIVAKRPQSISSRSALARRWGGRNSVHPQILFGLRNPAGRTRLTHLYGFSAAHFALSLLTFEFLLFQWLVRFDCHTTDFGLHLALNTVFAQ